MIRLRNTLAMGLAASALVFWGCLTGGSEAKDPPSPSGEVSGPIPYSVQGDRIIVPALSDTTYGCLGDSLALEIGTDEADTTPFRISGNTLMLIISVDSTASGAVVEWLELLVRMDGLGLEGTWRDSARDYRVVSGALTAAEMAEHDNLIETRRLRDSFKESFYVFNQGFIRAYQDEKTAERTMAAWTGTDPGSRQQAESLVYDIDFRIVDKYTVEYRGRRTSETVRVTEMPNGDLDFVSLNPEHSASHVPIKPTSCPVETVPAWYFDFLRSNAKSALPKRSPPGGRSVDPAGRPKTGFFARFFWHERASL